MRKLLGSESTNTEGDGMAEHPPATSRESSSYRKPRSTTTSCKPVTCRRSGLAGPRTVSASRATRQVVTVRATAAWRTLETENKRLAEQIKTIRDEYEAKIERLNDAPAGHEAQGGGPPPSGRAQGRPGPGQEERRLLPPLGFRGRLEDDQPAILQVGEVRAGPRARASAWSRRWPAPWSRRRSFSKHGAIVRFQIPQREIVG